jgi:hypothetical protein
MSNPKRAALYLRVSTNEQTVENQRKELHGLAPSPPMARHPALQLRSKGDDFDKRLKETWRDSRWARYLAQFAVNSHVERWRGI